MMRNILKLTVVGTLVAASVLMPLVLRHHAQGIRSEQRRLLREQAAQLAELSTENQRLSNLATHVKSPAFPAAQLSELLRLRGEIGQLRQVLAEADKLRAENQRLAATLTNTEVSPRASSLPEGQTVQAYWPLAQLGFVGYS